MHISLHIVTSSAVCVLPQLAISEQFTVNLHKSLIGALSFNFARHRQLRQHAVGSWRSCPPCLKMLIYKHFRCLYRIIYVSVVRGKKIKTPKGRRKKIKFFFGSLKTRSFANFGLRVGLERFANVCVFVRGSCCKVFDR